jgi:hypothetical protein
MDYGLLHGVDCGIRLVGYRDLDWSDNVTNRKSTLGCCFSLGTTVIAWHSRKQVRMVFLTTQGEHVHDWMEKGVVEVLGCGCVDQAFVQGEVGVLQRQACCGPSQEGVIMERLALVTESND